MSMREKDYDDDNDDLFREFSVDGDSLFDEEDEEIGVDFHVPNPSSESSVPVSSPSSNHIHISGKGYEISGSKPLPAAFKKQGVARALLFMKNGKVVVLK